MLWTTVPVYEDVAIAMMKKMATEAGMNVIAKTGMTQIVLLPSLVVKDDSNAHPGPHSPNGARVETYVRGLLISTSLSLSHLYICFLVPPCFFYPLRISQDGSTVLSTRTWTEALMAATAAAQLPDVSRAAAKLVLAVPCTHCSNYIICGFNFGSIFWSFYSNLMVHSHCRSPQP